MQGRIYTVSFTEVPVTAAVDVFELTAADDKPIEIVGLFLGQSSDFGDAQAENIPYSILRGHTTSGSGGTATTPRPLNASDSAAGFAAETNNTTAASAGTALLLHAGVFNVAVGEALWFPDGCQPSAPQASLLVVRLTNVPADSLDLSGTLYVREVG